jgi:hypothetical protein
MQSCLLVRNHEKAMALFSRSFGTNAIKELGMIKSRRDLSLPTGE